MEKDITGQIQSKQDQLWFLESLDRVNRAIQGTNDLDRMMRDALESVRLIFDSDRVFLFYPCDPNAPTFRVPMEVFKPEYPGAQMLDVDLPMTPDLAQNLREVLESDRPVIYVNGTERPVNKITSEQFGVQSQIAIAMYPKAGKPWAFGMHQCSYPRIWTEEERRLFQEIGRRLADGLSSLLMYRNLQESEEKYRRIIETTSEGIWVIDKERITTFVNPRMADMLEYAIDEMIGQKLDIFLEPEELADHEHQMQERSKGNAGFYERRFHRKDGKVVWCNVSATPIFNDKKQFAGSFAMITDITERKQAEMQIKELDVLKNKFIQTISHQMRTPLSIIRWQLESLLAHDHGVLNDYQEQLARSCYQADLDIIGRINEFITALEMEEGRMMRLGKAPMCLESIWKSVEIKFKADCELKKVDYESDMSETCSPPIDVDMEKIRFVMEKLAENALIYTNEGGKVKVAVRQMDGRVRFVIEDTGIGIPALEQSRIFTRFYRASNAGVMKPDSSGLGLYVSKHFIQAHGGTIGFTSEEGKGSTFWFEIPHHPTIEK